MNVEGKGHLSVILIEKWHYLSDTSANRCVYGCMKKSKKKFKMIPMLKNV